MSAEVIEVDHNLQWISGQLRTQVIVLEVGI